jgi:Flp pilus assembly protein TadB
MTTKTELRLQRWEQMRQRGLLKYALTHGTLFGATFFVFAWLTTPAIVPWLYLMAIFLIGGWIWGAAIWLVTMWIYRRQRRLSQ